MFFMRCGFLQKRTTSGLRSSHHVTSIEVNFERVRAHTSLYKNPNLPRALLHKHNNLWYMATKERITAQQERKLKHV